MSVKNAALFFEKCAAQPKMLARYEIMPVPDMLFAASCEGYAFNVDDLSKLIGGMEVWRIMQVDKQEINGESTLWRYMWGRSRLDYVVNELWSKTDEATRKSLIDGGEK